MIVVFSNCTGGIKLEEEAISEILVADTRSESGESGAEVSEVEDYFEDGRKGGRKGGPMTTSLGRSRTTGCNQWWITNLGTASSKAHKYSSFCQSSKRCEKK